MKAAAATRTELLLGREGVRNLADSFVVLTGCGAVGGYALEALVRAGIGRVRVVDDGSIAESNLNRQVLATRETVGRMKVEVAEERARSINPDIVFEGIPELVTARNVPRLLSGDPDILVDAIDTIQHKTLLLRYAAEQGMATFSSMGAALRTETDRIKVATLRKTYRCPLANGVRTGLKDVDTSAITCVFSDEEVRHKPTERNDRDKSILGSLPTVPAVFGMVLANEAIRYLAAGGRDGGSSVTR